jgi:site-specific DNA recombinase
VSKNKKIAAIYIRVSTDAQVEEGYSIDAQKEQLAAYCISKGIKDYEFYIDGGWSGSNLERPEMQRLIKDAKEERISHCIVYKLDRLSRSQKDTLYVIEDVLNPHNVDFVSLTESLDTSTPMGRLMIGILSAFAQLERENIRIRTRMGMKERVKDGYWMGGGRIPYGYDYDKDQGILVPNKDAEKVKKIYELYIQGYAAQNIANMMGLKYDRLAIQILKRKSNYGVIEYNGEEYQGRHEPIISKETYDIAMNEMLRRSISNVTTSENLLTGLVYCGKCGAKMRYQKWGKKGTKLVCYSQQKSKPYLVKDPNCKQEKPWADEIESFVIKTLFQLKNRKPKDSDDMMEDTKIEMLNNQREELEKKVKKLYNLYAESEDDILLDTINENKRKLALIKQTIESEIIQRNLISNKEQLKDSIETLEDKWDYMTQQEKQNIVRFLVEKVSITDNEIGIKLTI